MRVFLAAVNAKYIHTNLAIRSLKAYCESRIQCGISLAEYTINQRLSLILREIYKQKPEVLGFSVYIWNVSYVYDLVRELKKLLPDCLIFLGGPEVSHTPADALERSGADAVISGEGERAFADMISALVKGKPYTAVPGLSYRNGDTVYTNPPAPLLALDELPFPYSEGVQDLTDRILYYESSRGCPFHCQYCLSGDDPVRFLSLERVYNDLDRFLFAKVPQVKFVDRTFNCNRERALAIWRYLSQNDNGVTNFHFEIAAEILEEEAIAFLNTVRPGLFQFEIGVQSIHPETLSAIKRNTVPKTLTDVIRGLQRGGNIHLHLDLIAGLPLEGYETFRESFNFVFSLSPDQLQLGFLKLLKGSGLTEYKTAYGILASDMPPYEVLSTDCLSYDELLRLKTICDMCELYYNSGRFSKETQYLISLFETPFDCFEALGDLYYSQNRHLIPPGKLAQYDFLYEFLQSLPEGNLERFRWLCLYDISASEKPRRLPEWLLISQTRQYKNLVYDFIQTHADSLFSLYEGEETKQILKLVQIQWFPFDPRTGENKAVLLLFRYRNGDCIEIPTDATNT